MPLQSCCCLPALLVSMAVLIPVQRARDQQRRKKCAGADPSDDRWPTIEETEVFALRVKISLIVCLQAGVISWYYSSKETLQSSHCIVALTALARNQSTGNKDESRSLSKSALAFYTVYIYILFLS